MAPKSKGKTLTEYERQRLDNIRRNQEMMSALMLRRKASDLSAAAASAPAPKRPKTSPKAPIPSSPIVIRRSLRTRGVPPSSSSDAAGDAPPAPDCPPQPWKRGPLLIRDALVSGDTDSGLVGAILGSSAGEVPAPVTSEGFDATNELVLRPENAAKVVSDRILSIKFLPIVDRTVVVVGNKLGNLGFWDVDCSSDDNAYYIYQPHSAPVSGISIHPISPRKVYTSSYDGFIRLMDVEKGTFNMIVSSEYSIYSICHWPRELNSLYIGEGAGMVRVWDEREGKDTRTWELHDARINTIDFNPENGYSIATSSTDGYARIWDLRSINKDRPECIREIKHERAVHSAYFSPNGNFLATTCLDDTIGIASGNDFDNMVMVSHNNQTGRWLSTFRAIWGWNDSCIYIGNMRRAIDVISTSSNTVTSLDSPDIMTSIPCRFAVHPYKLGHIAGATSGGKVFLWTKG